MQSKVKHVLSHRQREWAAKEKQQSITDDLNDPEKTLIRAIRAETIALGQVSMLAERKWRADNAPMPPPRAICGPLHPQRAAALAEFVAGWSDDSRQPITPGPSMEEYIADMQAQTQANLSRLDAEYMALQERKSTEEREDAPIRASAFEEDCRARMEMHAIVRRATTPTRSPVAGAAEVVVDEDAPVRTGRSG